MAKYARGRRFQNQTLAAGAHEPAGDRTNCLDSWSAPAVLFGLEQGLGVQLYVAIPMAIVVYLAVKVAFGLLWGADDKAT